jgi:flagellin-specific chaperone FliS
MGFKEILSKTKLKNERGVTLINPLSNDYIICEYEPHTLTQHEQKILYDGLQTTFRDNKVVLLPSNVNVLNCTKDEIQKIIKGLQYVLDYDTMK